jgi:hypothetical protein
MEQPKCLSLFLDLLHYCSVNQESWNHICKIWFTMQDGRKMPNCGRTSFSFKDEFTPQSLFWGKSYI